MKTAAFGQLIEGDGTSKLTADGSGRLLAGTHQFTLAPRTSQSTPTPSMDIQQKLLKPLMAQINLCLQEQMAISEMVPR